jgi:hypothetical protein
MRLEAGRKANYGIGDWGGVQGFLSTDPLTSSYPMLTPYQFASNTPIQAIDLDGLEAFFVHGTASSSERWKTKIDKTEDSDVEWEPNEAAHAIMRMSSNKTANIDFEWGNGGFAGPINVGNGFFNSPSDRYNAAQKLADHVMDNLALIEDGAGNMIPAEDITLIGHSHGGNVSIQAAKLIRRRLNEKGGAYKDVEIHLVTVATPAANYSTDTENPESLLRDGTLTSHNALFSDKDGVVPKQANKFGGRIGKYNAFDASFQNNMTVNTLIHGTEDFETSLGNHSIDINNPDLINETIDSEYLDKGGKIESYSDETRF